MDSTLFRQWWLTEIQQYFKVFNDIIWFTMWIFRVEYENSSKNFDTDNVYIVFNTLLFDFV